MATAKEQLLYEVVNPHAYYTPDVIADFTSVHLKELGPNQIEVTGGSGKGRPDTYKVSVGYQASFSWERVRLLMRVAMLLQGQDLRALLFNSA